MPGVDGPELTAAKRLLDAAKSQGFTFQRIAPGPDGPLLGVRETVDYRDTCYLSGFGEGCSATRARKYSLVVPGPADHRAGQRERAGGATHSGKRLGHLMTVPRKNGDSFGGQHDS